MLDLRDRHPWPGTDRRVGHPGLALWRVLVRGVIQPGPGGDFDRWHDRVNPHHPRRLMRGRRSVLAEALTGEYQTLVGHVSRLTPDLWREGNRRVVDTGHEGAGNKSWAAAVTASWSKPRCPVQRMGTFSGRPGVA